MTYRRAGSSGGWPGRGIGRRLVAELCSHLHLVSGQVGTAVTRVQLQVGLEYGAVNEASAIKCDVRKISDKQVGQIVFVVQSLSSETLRVRGASPFWDSAAMGADWAHAPATANDVGVENLILCSTALISEFLSRISILGSAWVKSTPSKDATTISLTARLKSCAIPPATTANLPSPHQPENNENRLVTGRNW